MMMRTTARVVAAIVLGAAPGCKPSDVLSVPAPTGVIPASAQANQSGAEGIEGNGTAYLAQGFSQQFNGVLLWSGMLGDEFHWAWFSNSAGYANIDARITEGGRGYLESGDNSLVSLMLARFTLLTAVPLLERYEPTSGRAKIGLAFALIGYTELLAGEDFCAGLPLATPTVNGVTYGVPLTSDSLLGVAQAHFDSAVAYAGSDPVVAPLAHVGLARTRLDRANFVGAAAAAAQVPTSFVYNAQLEPGGYNLSGLTISNVYEYAVSLQCGYFAVSNGKGQNGLNYIAAGDPRLVFDTTIGETCDGSRAGAADSVWYYPVKFGNPSTAVPLATGAEARLIEAEAALRAGQVSTWAADLNALRANAPVTYLALATSMPALTADSTTSAAAAMRIDVMFRERAFWLFGMGSRLGDMRRLIRQYGRDQSTVFPIGPYPYASMKQLPSPLLNYGTEVNLTLPTAAGSLNDPNPNYRGCISRAA